MRLLMSLVGVMAISYGMYLLDDTRGSRAGEIQLVVAFLVAVSAFAVSVTPHRSQMTPKAFLRVLGEYCIAAPGLAGIAYMYVGRSESLSWTAGAGLLTYMLSCTFFGHLERRRREADAAQQKLETQAGYMNTGRQPERPRKRMDEPREDDSQRVAVLILLSVVLVVAGVTAL